MTTTTPVPQPASGERIAMNIVYQLGDLYELPVELRQRTNDQAIDFVQKLVEAARAEGRREELETIEKFRKMYHNNPNDLYGDLETELAVRLAQLNGERS